MARPPDTRPGLRRSGGLALGLLAAAYVMVMQSTGWAQTSYMALIKSVTHDGTPRVDRYHWESRDVAYVDGHYYSVKAPGLPALTVPLYAALDAVGGDRLAGDVAAVARRNGASRWHNRNTVLTQNYGFSAARRDRVQSALERQSPMLWALGLLGTVLPAMALLVLVRRCCERIEPGYGTAAAVTLGAGTLVLTFATQLFGHVLAAALTFGAFALLMRERAGPPRTALVALAGLLSGLAVTTEYTLALAGAIIGIYAVTRGGVLRRGAAYTAGVVAGVLPLLAYNLWAFGSVTHMSYVNAVAATGYSGHARLGLNETGFFGITLPEPLTALELLFSARGLLTLSPVLAVAAYGLVLVARRGARAEALTAAAIAVSFLVWNSGYWTPFGGGTPGPRFLIPILPFLALGLASAWRARPAVTAALTVPSVTMMLAAALTRPLIGDEETAGEWARLIADGLFSNTLLSAVGLGNGWVAALPVAALIVFAVALARPRGLRVAASDTAFAAKLLVAWALVAASAPALWHRGAAVTGDTGSLALIAAGTLGGGVVLALARYRGGAEARTPSAPVENEAHDLSPQLAT